MLRTMAIGDTLHVFDDTTRAQVEAQAQRALQRGEEVVREDGTVVWIETTIRFDPRQEGAAAYTWDAARERVLHDRQLTELERDGTLKKTDLKPVFRKFGA